MSVEVRILGPVEAHTDGGAVPLARAKTRALLAFLALEESREVPRERLIDALWGERELRDAKNSLQAQVARLRRAFAEVGEPDIVLTRPGGYALNLAVASVDLHRFEQLARAGRHALSEGDAATAAVQLAEALALWRGRPLAGLGDEPFVPPAAARISERRLAVVEDRVEADLILGRHDDAVVELSSLVAEEPYRERLWRQLSVALYRCGRQAEALEALRRARRTLADELGLEPGPELRRLERAILEQADWLAPPAHAERPAARAPDIPFPAARLVDREEELRLVRSLLQQADLRIVTLTGSGGTGKTRLALAVAHVTAAAFADGAAFVDLATVRDPERVPAAVAEQLGVVPESDRSPLEPLVDHLRRRRQLIVLDNFEQVVAAAPTVGELAAACAGVRFLVTSREPLRVAAEREVCVRPLELPEADDADSLARRCARARAGALRSARLRAARRRRGGARHRLPAAGRAPARAGAGGDATPPPQPRRARRAHGTAAGGPRRRRARRRTSPPHAAGDGGVEPPAARRGRAARVRRPRRLPRRLLYRGG